MKNLQKSVNRIVVILFVLVGMWLVPVIVPRTNNSTSSWTPGMAIVLAVGVEGGNG